MTDTLVKSLTAKLAEVMRAVKRIPKHGRNEFHHYDYATEADIVAAIREELADRVVMLIPSVVGESRYPVGEKGSVLTVLDMEMEFRDGDTNESIVKTWRGYGTDKEDKGGYKAMTGGEKYFLLKTFLIPTGDDPEREDAPERKPVTAAPRRTAPARRSEPDDPLPHADQYRVTGVKVLKEGTKNKTPWTLFGVTVHTGQTFLTFSTTIADQANHALQTKVPLQIDTEASKKGTDRIILSVTPVTEPEPA
jgi:hypothetical protein